ncbi:PadR family transcriptional regulator [Rubrobacter calidifluminis]|uniref:PadR family transcriptional regulator n=1 Tax=Rubrobacter calidifluminis TaxID=1392640 RepID=UPI0023602C08|nr:PadR family transcriptional regulator [Rubrobacter calidifluminis]
MFGARRKRGTWFDSGRMEEVLQRRVFGKGDLKYVIAELLEEGPAHGYEAIRRLESRFRGMYSPSPGSVYPTLQLLEDMGYVSSEEKEGRKIYSLTEEGRSFVSEHRESMREIWRRAAGVWEGEHTEELREIAYEGCDLLRKIRRAIQTGRVDEEKLRRIRDAMREARRKVEDILSEDDRDEDGGRLGVGGR